MVVMLTGLDCVASEDLIPNEQMKAVGGKPISLFTGLYYTMGVRSGDGGIPNGYVTYTNEDSGSGHYMQIALKDYPRYRPGGDWRDAASVCFCSSEAPSYYTVGVKALPGSCMTYTDKASASGRYMQIATKNLRRFGVGGDWREDALWGLWDNDGDPAEWYTMGVKHGVSDGYVTYTDEESPSGRYMQVATGSLERFRPGGDWRGTALWHFWPAGYRLAVTIGDFRYDQDIIGLIRESVSPLDLAARSIFQNDGDVELTQRITHEKRLKNSASWSFEESESTRFSDKFTIHAEASGSFLGLFSASADTTNVFSWEWNRDTRTAHRHTEEKESIYRVDQTVRVPPRTRVEVNSLVNWAENITVPFTAIATIHCFADRASSGGGSVSSAPVDLAALRYFMDRENYRGTLLETTRNSVRVQITGSIKVNAALNTLVTTRNLPL